MRLTFKELRIKYSRVKSFIGNYFSSSQLFYIVPEQNWSIRHDGESLCAYLQSYSPRLTTSSMGLKQGIVHFGTIADTLTRKGQSRIPADKHLKKVVTWFHVLDGDKRLLKVQELNDQIDLWHTSCTATAKILVDHGIPENKIKVIPLGVDNSVFYPSKTALEKTSLRKKLGISEEMIVIGSFQKDGIGWKHGVKPKLEKGPDIFCDVMDKLAQEYPIFVLLSGPARGYVINRLKKSGIPFFHTGYLSHANDVAEYFRILDLYVISSRIEGGPKSALEAAACGIPLVSTPVGMVSDVHVHGETAMVTDSADANLLFEACCQVLSEAGLSEKLSQNGIEMALRYDWSHLAARYSEEIYLPLLRK